MLKEKTLVTNDEYNQILKDEADRFWKRVFEKSDAGITGKELEQYKKQYYLEFQVFTDQYEIIPFEINTNSEELKRLINLLCDEEHQKNKHCKLYRGSIKNVDLTGDSNSWWHLLKQTGFNDSIEGGKSQGNKELLTISNYCEGDVNFTVHNTLEDYNREVAELEEFYQNYY